MKLAWHEGTNGRYRCGPHSESVNFVAISSGSTSPWAQPLPLLLHEGPCLLQGPKASLHAFPEQARWTTGNSLFPGLRSHRDDSRILPMQCQAISKPEIRCLQPTVRWLVTRWSCQPVAELPLPLQYPHHSTRLVTPPASWDRVSTPSHLCWLFPMLALDQESRLGSRPCIRIGRRPSRQCSLLQEVGGPSAEPLLKPNLNSKL